MKNVMWKCRMSAAVLAVVALTMGEAGAAVTFSPMDPTWSIPVQVTTNGTASGVYSPVSAITSSMNLKVTFGVTNTTASATTLPNVSFKIQDATGAQVKTWTKSGGASLPGNKVTWIDGGDCTSYIRSLAAGNYRLEAKLGTSDTRYFRFAMRDTSKTLASAFSGAWTGITAVSGNDFAAPPFAAGTATTGVASGTTPTVQFGPFAPMDGIREYRPGSEKAPLDIVFLIDLTGSMGSCIEGLKSNVTTFFRTLVEGDAEHTPIENWRAKVVGYRDYFDDWGNTSYPWYVDNEWTANVNTLISQISACTATGGGDGLESLLDAMWEISHTTSFREGASRVVLTFSDIGYKGTGLYSPWQDDWREGSANCQYGTGDSLFNNSETYLEYLQGASREAGELAAANELMVKVIVSDTYKYQYTSDDADDWYHIKWLTDYCYSTNSTYQYVSDLGSFTADADSLRNLAQSVSASVKPAEIVEPMLSARVTGPGVLTYEWRNVSEAGTNNTFRFKMTGGLPVEEELPASSSSAWTTQTYVLGAGDYTCQWFYKKLGYDGGLIDCGQVRNIAFAVEPGPPVVTASDGTSSAKVSVSWTAPSSIGTVNSYEIARTVKGDSSWTVLGTTAFRTWEDSTASPGVDYTYRVRAQNSAGWGDYGSDNGWRAVSLSLSPTTLSFDYSASSKSVTVTANATWNISGMSGCASATKGSGSISVSVTQNGTLSSRPGSVTVTAGSGTDHPVSATVSITQRKRPAILTKLEITGGDTSLEGGESTTFHAIATFDDGITRDVTTAATWSITAGGTYGSVGAHTGKLTTYKTTDTSAGLTVNATYTNADYTSVTKSDSVNVTIDFTASLRRPVSLTVNGDREISIGETKPYTATVTYNDGTTAEKTLDAATAWTVVPASPAAEIAKGSAAAELTPHAGGNVLSVTAAYSETVARLTGSGTETVTVSGTLSVTVAAPIPLPVAVDVEAPGGAKLYDLAIATSSSVGGNVWYGQSAVSHDSTDAGQSGYLTGAGTNTMSTVVTNAGTISFWWKVSSEPVYDTLSFSVDGVERARISGTSDEWRHLSFSVGAGTHTFAWSYGKDGENNAGQDAGWVDQIVWRPLQVPGAPGVVNATDGSSAAGIDVTWTPSISGGTAEGYELSRSVKGSGVWTVLTNGFVGTAWRDADIDPGVDYTYRVRATNAAGGGSYEYDDGWRDIDLSVAPETIAIGHSGAVTNFSVESSVAWTVASNDGWISAKGAGDSSVSLAIEANPGLEERIGTVAVSAGTQSHSVTATVSVVQGPRPPVMDVGFCAPFEDWRTRMQISTNTTPDKYYAPVSVFVAGEPLDISFGWTNKSEVAVQMPSVRFRFYKEGDPDRICVADGTSAGRHGEMLPPGEANWSGHWKSDVLKVLRPGDYLLEAEIAPADAFGDADRSDNTAIFRFAVRDPSLSGDDAFPQEDGWTNLVFTVGNDFAQPPHLAMRAGSAGTNETAVQFGPYVPMNGINGHKGSVKKPLDLVFLIDYSGSMSGCIAGLVNNIGNFIDQLLLGDPGKGIDPLEDLRVKIVGFNDTQNYRSKEWFHEGEFTTDRSQLKSDLVWLRANCGLGSGNGGESSFDALYYLCKGWKPQNPFTLSSPHVQTDVKKLFRGTNEASRVVIMFTDEPPMMPFNMSYYKTLESDSSANNENYCMNLLSTALMEANINLTIVNDGFCYKTTSPYKENYPRFANLVNRDLSMRELIEYGGYHGALAAFTGDADLLRGLATNVSAKVAVEAKVVEPSFSAAVRGGGTLKFDWKNDSMATTNNTFSFVCEGVTNLTKAAGGDWETVTLELGEGLHVFNWSYGKLGGYVSDIVTDCGVLSNVRWEPWHTELEIEPPRVPTYYTGIPITQTNDEDTVVFDVTCNSIWKVVDHSDWITVVQGNGTGDGDLVVTVATNNTYAERLGYITVRAGEYGLPSDAKLGILERKVFIQQEANPYNEDGSVEVLTVDIKPRWPWSRKVDIDFRVKTPAKNGTPVKVKVWGLNKEGGDMITHYPTAAMLQECAAKNGVEVGFTTTNSTVGTAIQATTAPTIGGIDSDGMAYIYCPTSGLYRFTWDMATDWKNVSATAQAITKVRKGYQPWANGYFHTPKFSARLKVEPINSADSTNPSHEMEAKETRRVDMRLVNLSTGWTRPNLGREGGSVLAGTAERIGHPFGWADPVVIDTTDKTLFESNGWNHLDFMEKKWADMGYSADLLSKETSYTLTNRTDIACVLNNENVAVEGGMITNDVHWTSDKIHVVRDNVFVVPDAKLTIDAETIVKVCIDTRIYVWENDLATIITDRHNIVVEGSYFPYPADATCGGDTFYLGENAGSGSSTDARSGGGAIVYSQVQSGKTAETEEIYGTEKCGNRAIYRLELAEQWRDVNGTVTPKRNQRYKYYSKGYEYGDILPPSEPGCAFYGWYTQQPKNISYLGSTINSTGYVSSQAYFVNPMNCPFQLNKSYSGDVTIWALVCPIGWAEVPGSVLRSAADGRIVLATESVVYDGNDHTGDIKVKELWLGAVDISNSISSVNVPSPCRNVGEYPITVNFAADYANSPSATFRILPRAAEGARLVFSPASMMYERTLSKPSVDVLLPDGTTLPADGYAVRWLDADGRWPNIGKYKVEAALTGNYSGTPVTNEFEIAVNPDYVYKDYAAEELVRKAVSDKPKTEDGTAPRRILYIGGRENDAMTEYVKDLLARDIELCDFINANFACWADDIDAAGSKGALYAAGLQSDTPPILAIVSANDMTRALAAHSGYIARDELWDFLVAAKTLPEDVSSASLSLSSAILEYNGKMQRPAVSVVYAGTDIPVSEGELVWSGGCTNVGVYTVKAVFGGGPYVGETAAATFEIVPAALPEYAVELVPDAVVYDGETHKPAVSVPDGVSASVDYGAGDYTAAGTYDVSVTGTGNYRGTVAKTFTISRRPVSAWIELDSAKVEITDEKPPADPLRPRIIAVKDGTRAVYSGGVDYTVDWGGGDYRTPGTNTITATFIGNYEGVATATFVIERVEPPASKFNPSTGEPVKVSASDAATAAGMVEIVVPDAVAARVSITDEAYGKYFEKRATYDERDGLWAVDAVLKADVVFPEEADGEMERAVLDGVLDPATDRVTVRSVPGIYYRLLGANTLDRSRFAGKDAVLATGACVTLEKPGVSGSPAFYMLSASPKE